jgi:D-alanyl-D-alanine carboxypeptidase
VLVNKYHGVTRDYEPKDMVTVEMSMAAWDDIQIKKEAYDAFVEMFNDAAAQGYSFCICSGYRSYEYQQELFENALATQSEEEAHMFSAYPGRSEHHTGLAIDITSESMDWALSQDFASYPEGQWLDEHCQDYGFILRYQKGKEDITGYQYEPWHFRYVGKEVAKDIMSRGITFEEYLGEN